MPAPPVAPVHARLRASVDSILGLTSAVSEVWSLPVESLNLPLPLAGFGVCGLAASPPPRQLVTQTVGISASPRGSPPMVGTGGALGISRNLSKSKITGRQQETSSFASAVHGDTPSGTVALVVNPMWTRQSTAFASDLRSPTVPPTLCCSTAARPP